MRVAEREGQELNQVSINKEFEMDELARLAKRDGERSLGWQSLDHTALTLGGAFLLGGLI